MITISFWQMVIFVTVIWIIIRIIFGIKNGGTSFQKEAGLLPVFFCMLIVFRIVYFPWHLVDGKIGPLIFDPSRIDPPWVNLHPFIVREYAYSRWKFDVYGNVIMFIPVGFIWPLCFKKLDTVWKTVLAGGTFTLLIELSQLLFYERCSDIDDFMYNTIGAFLGALIYFGGKKILSFVRGKERSKEET